MKEPQLIIVNSLKKKFSINTSAEVINKFIKSALNMNKNNLIFNTSKEKCRGGCFASEPVFEFDMSENIFIQLKKIYTENHFYNYKTEEEEVSKVIRCIIDFIEDKPSILNI